MIKNVIFDLGNVLVKVNPGRFRENLLANGADEEVFDNALALENIIQFRFETGVMSEKEFIACCISVLNEKISPETFVDSFNSMFDEIPEMKNFLEELVESKKYKIYLLSNTNPIHFDYITGKFKYVNLIKNNLLSYRLKCIKPGIEIYEKIIKENNLVPEETIFIDDLKENCDAAEKTGIKTIQYSDHSDFIEKFYQLTL